MRAPCGAAPHALISSDWHCQPECESSVAIDTAVAGHEWAARKIAACVEREGGDNGAGALEGLSSGCQALIRRCDKEPKRDESGFRGRSSMVKWKFTKLHTRGSSQQRSRTASRSASKAVVRSNKPESWASCLTVIVSRHDLLTLSRYGPAAPPERVRSDAGEPIDELADRTRVHFAN